MNDQEVECKFLSYGTGKEIHKKIKWDTIKELACPFHCLIPVRNLSILDEDIREYLLYTLFSMQYAMGNQLKLPDALLTRTESNKDWTQQGLRLARKTPVHYRKLPEE